MQYFRIEGIMVDEKWTEKNENRNFGEETRRKIFNKSREFNENFKGNGFFFMVSTTENIIKIGAIIINEKNIDNVQEMENYKAEMIFQVAVNDIDMEVLPEYGFTFDTFFTEAEELAEFIKKANSKNMDIICQCEYGQSRSAACAAAILEYYEKKGISIFADYRYYPNQVIFNKIYNALKSKGSI